MVRVSPKLAPFTFAVFPLVNKEGIPELSEKVYQGLKADFKGVYDSSGSIGKRYARVDEIGVPVAITLDYQTIEDKTATVRDRDTGKQTRVTLDELPELLRKVVQGSAFNIERRG